MSTRFVEREISPVLDDGFRERPFVSIVLPIFDEEENIPDLYLRLRAVLELPAFAGKGAEILFVDDGSGDTSAQMIADLRKTDARVKLLSFSRNFGHQAAITAGMEHSSGDAVVIMDSDLQDPPEILEAMVEEWQSGADVVYAVRRKRKETFGKRLAYYSFYRILQRIAKIDIPLDSGDFCLMNRQVVDQLKRMPERNRFVRGLRSWVGYNQVAVEYERDARASGQPKYTFGKLMKLALDGILSFSSFPLRLATYLGFITVLLGLTSLIVIVVAYFIDGDFPQGWASIIAVVLFVSGVQLLILGAIGEYVALIHDEVKQRPKYIVREFLD
ncbi:MAG: glycosyltransferase family 2 protein [Acidobacteria bacterium]|nr:glycosyltransferase family 2 protein [Acidobacteriota bacterium]MCA1609047.1 glycosyltransferase family 2 protein [Acidobacteriota bacterium]